MGDGPRSGSWNATAGDSGTRLWGPNALRRKHASRRASPGPGCSAPPGAALRGFTAKGAPCSPPRQHLEPRRGRRGNTHSYLEPPAAIPTGGVSPAEIYCLWSHADSSSCAAPTKVPPVSHELHLYFFPLKARAQPETQTIAQGASRDIRTDALPAWRGLPDAGSRDQPGSSPSPWEPCTQHVAFERERLAGLRSTSSRLCAKRSAFGVSASLRGRGCC